jgi:ribosome-associated protein
MVLMETMINTMRRRDRLAAEADAEEQRAQSGLLAPDALPEFNRVLSKTQLKQEAQALQGIGRQLLTLSADQLLRLQLPPPLHDAIVEMRRISSHEGKRRHLQLIGKLMRQVDAEPIREALAAARLGGARESLCLHRTEAWRARMVQQDEAIAAFVREHPEADEPSLRRLVARARLEHQATPSQASGDTRHGRAWRELFQLIKPWISSHV